MKRFRWFLKWRDLFFPRNAPRAVITKTYGARFGFGFGIELNVAFGKMFRRFLRFLLKSAFSKTEKNVKFSTFLQDFEPFSRTLQTNSPISVTTLHVKTNGGVRLVSRPKST
jgi:hypothetical protein